MGFVWDEIEMPDDQGNMQKEISKAGTKIKAEGDFGHEPDLEIETAQMDDPDLVRFDKVHGRARRNFKSQMIHVATVKKCRVWSLNGEHLPGRIKTAYKVGYYQKVAEPFKEYFDSLGVGGAHAVTKSERTGNSSAVLFNSGSEHRPTKPAFSASASWRSSTTCSPTASPGGEKRSKLDAMYRN